MQKMLKK